jgi:ABC-type nitrate/sulfonate/bicarbonate transport system ATPase subunit
VSDLALVGLGKTYPTPRGPAVIVEQVELEVADGEVVSLIGHSGCGKSTVLSMIAGLIAPTTGEILVGGRLVRGPGVDRGMVFQTPCLLPWLDVVHNVMLGLGQLGTARERRTRAERALASVGLADAVHARPTDLSAGMRQRAALARALALQPRMLLLDEPFGMLDSVTRSELQDLVLGLGAARPTTVLVTHDIDEALMLSDRVAVMTDGPAARIRAVVDIPFGATRTRESAAAHPAYDALREELLGLLDERLAARAA